MELSKLHDRVSEALPVLEDSGFVLVVLQPPAADLCEHGY